MTENLPARWSAGTVYDDMWVDPEDDPRLGESSAPDGELATLLAYLHDYRATIRMKADGLDPAQLAARSVPPSTMSLLGIVRHLAGVERYWGEVVLGRRRVASLFDGDGDVEFDGAVADGAVVTQAFALWDQQIDATDAVIATREDLGARVPRNGPPIAVREVLLHLIEEYARHAGHADLLRERIDGRVGQ